MVTSTSGCNAIRNGWLDPTAIGSFHDTKMLEIRSSLTLEDVPDVIPGASAPLRRDLQPVIKEYPIRAGDTLLLEINELRERQIPFQAQIQVLPTGQANIPVLGRVEASGLTTAEFEQELIKVLEQRDILRDPQVTVNPLFMQAATYSLFGIGVSAANNAPLRAGTFPIRRPDLRILEAINSVGGLNEFVTDIYVFRYDSELEMPVNIDRDSAETGDSTQIDDPSVGIDAPAGSLESDAAPENGAAEESLGSDRAQVDVDVIDPDLLAPPPIEESTGPGAAQLEEKRQAEDSPDHSSEKSPGDSSGEYLLNGPDEYPSNNSLEGHILDLEPDPAQPYLFVEGRFVPNPVYKPPDEDEARPQLDFDTATPAVNWSRIAGDTSYRIIRIQAEALRKGDPDANIVVRGGDVIRVVSGEIGVYYMMGQVNRVGAFAFNSEQITLKSAVATAGGLSTLAWPDRCTVYRRIGQREQMIQVNLDRIFAGKTPDFVIRRGDIINVGTHPFAPFLQRIRALTLPNPVNNMGYSFTYSRNFADIDSFSVQQNPRNQPDRFPQLFP